MISFGSCFILYYKSNDMKHISFLNDSVFMDAVINFNRSSQKIPDGLPSFSAIYPLDIAPFSKFPLWGYFLIGVCIVSVLALVLLLYSNRQLRRKKSPISIALPTSFALSAVCWIYAILMRNHP